MRLFSVLSIVMLTGPLMAQEPVELQVEVTNVPLLIKEDSVAVGGLRSTQVQVANGSQIISFSEEVSLLDVSFAPVPPITRRISGICQIRLLVNEVPLKISGYSVAASLVRSPPASEPDEDTPPVGLVTTLRLELFGFGSSVVPGAQIEITPNDIIRIETVSLPKELDCTADFVIVAEAI